MSADRLVEGVDNSSEYSLRYAWIFVSVLIVAGGLCNIFICLAIGLNRKLQTATNALFFSLAIADLFVCFFVMPLAASAEVFGKFRIFCSLVWLSTGQNEGKKFLSWCQFRWRLLAFRSHLVWYLHIMRCTCVISQHNSRLLHKSRPLLKHKEPDAVSCECNNTVDLL